MSKFDLPETIQAARIRCVQDRPYLSSILYRLVPVAEPGMGTMAVDKFGRLYYDPTCTWTVQQYETVLYHEVCHLLRDHSGRAESMGIEPQNHKAWNVCADAEINDDINAEGNTQWPFQVVTPASLKQPDGLFAEEYYAQLPKKGDPSMGMGQGDGQGNPQPGSGKCGGAAGAPLPFEHAAPANAGGDKDATPGLSEAEADAVRQKVASDIREHVKSRGTVPGHLAAWADAFLNPKVDWRKVLRAQVRHTVSDIAGMLNFTYQRPSRRTVCTPNIILPSMRQPVPQIACVIDSSGSVSDDDLSQAISEVSAVLKQCGAKDGVAAIVCDAGVGFAKRVFKADQIKVEGRGGTDMRVGIDHALAMRPKPHAVIILTDGHTPWPDVAPHGVRIIAVLIGTGKANPESVPEYIKVVVVD